MDLRINQTGVRSNELITSNGKSKQNKGAVIEVRGLYPPSKIFVNQLDPATIRDEFNVIPFFTNMSPGERKTWLLENASDNKDLYINDIPGISFKFVKIEKPAEPQKSKNKDTLYVKLGEDTVNTLLRGNPADPEGFWPVNEVMAMFPRKPGSRTKLSRTTLMFRPSMWSLMIPKRLAKQYTGVYIGLNTGVIGSGTISSPPGGKIYSFEFESKVKNYLPKLGIVVTKNIITPLTEETLFKLASNYVPIEQMKIVKPFIDWFPPSLHKSLIQKLIRTRCDSVEYSGKIYPAGVFLLTSLSLLLLNPGVFVPNIQRFVTGIESASKRLAVTIHEDSYVDPKYNNILMQMYASAMIAQDDRNWLPTDTMLNDWFVVALEAQKDTRAYKYDFRTFDGKIEEYNHLSLSYFLLSEVRSFHSDIDMLGSIAQNGGDTKPTIDGKITVMPLIHCLDQHSLAEIAHYMPYTKQPYPKLFNNIWTYVVGVNPRYEKNKDYFPTMEDQAFVKDVRLAQRDTWISKMYTPQPRAVIPNITTDFSYTIDISWLAGLVGTIEIELPKTKEILEGTEVVIQAATAIVVLRVDDIYDMTAVKRPKRDDKTPELTENQQIKAIEQAKVRLGRGLRLKNVPSTIPILNYSIITLSNDQYIVTLSNKKNYLWETIINLTYKFPIHTSISPTINNAIMHTGDGIDQASGDTIQNIITKYDPDAIRRLSAYLAGYKSCINLAKISRDGTGTYYQVVPEDTAVNHILCYLCVMYPAAIVKTRSGFKVKNGPLLWTVRDCINSQLGHKMTFDRKWVQPKPETRKRWEHQIDSVKQMVERNKAGKKGHLIWIKVGLGKCLHPLTPVLTWDGSAKLARDIVPGDTLIGDDNTPRTVLSTCKGIDKMYRIKQTKGEDYIVNEPHILSLKFSGHKSYSWMEKYHRFQLTWFDKVVMMKKQKVFSIGNTKRFKYKTKDEAYEALIEFRNTIPDDNIVDITVKDFLKLSMNTQKELKGFKVGVDFPSKDVSIDPYILGCWLGDGASNGSAFTNVDGECLRSFEKYMNEIGCEMAQKKTDKITYGIRNKVRNRNKNNWLNLLDKYNLINNKHIPLEYRRNSRQVRLDILAGLIDTDGYYGGGCYEIIQKRKLLSEHIQYLARSLGYSVSYTPCIKTCTNGKNGPVKGLYYKCIISGDMTEIPCRIERKKPNPRLQKKDPMVTGIEIEYVGVGGYCGFAIDGNRRFLLGDFTVTHNTLITVDYLDHLITEGKMPAYCVYTLPPSAIDNILKEFVIRGIPTKLIDARQSSSKNSKIIEPYKVCIIKHDQMRIGTTEAQMKAVAREMVFIVDEFHKTLNPTQRTSIALEMTRLSYDFIGMSGTIIKDNNYAELIQWLEQIVEFEVTKNNYWVALGALVSKKVYTRVVVDRQTVEVPLGEFGPAYYSLVPEKLGGTARHIDFQGATNISYKAVTQAIVNTTFQYVQLGEGVFVVAKDIKHQKEIRDKLIGLGLNDSAIHLFSKDAQVTLTPDYTGPIKVVITTKQHSEGYTLTKFRIMISSVYFSNQATRDQLEGRINRIGQTSTDIRVIIYHAGILTYTHEKYEKTRTWAAAMKGFADEVGLDYKALKL